MTDEKPPLRDDVMREVRARALPIGLLIGTTIAAVIIGFLTDWRY